jgi:hypothetical protein
MADWFPQLLAGEQICWEGRPAPRCYTFRYWRFSLTGAVILFLLGGWQGVAVPMGAPQPPVWLIFAVAELAFLLLLGLPLWQRFAWESIFYAITERRLLVRDWRRVKAIPLATITAVTLDNQGAELGTLKVDLADGPPLTLACLEYPRIPEGMLKAGLKY